MRIARVLTRLNLGGPARQVLASDPVLAERGHEIRIFAGAPEPGEGALDDELRDAGLDVRSVPGLRRSVRGAFDGSDWRVIRFLAKELSAFDPDVVHTHASKAGVVGRRAAIRSGSRARRVHTFHGHVLEGYFPRPVSALMRAAERSLARTTHGIVAVSEATRADLVRFGIARSDEIDVVPPGVVIEPLVALPLERPGSALRRARSIPPGAPVISAIGRLAEVKRPTLALDVFARVAGEFPEAHMLFAGDGSERGALEARIAELPGTMRERVHLLGAVTEIERVHEANDVLLSTSFSEGMPVAMIEAAASGRPVVTTAVGGVPEVVRSGVTGLFGTDAAALAAALGGLLGDPGLRRQLGTAARERAALQFGPISLANRLEAVYSRLLVSPA